MTDIKNIYSSEKKENKDVSTIYKQIREKLDGAIKNEEWSLTELIDHDYCQPEILDCVIYYVTGYLSNHILKRVKCNVCTAAFTDPMGKSPFPEAVLVHMTTDQTIVHPNIKMFQFIKYLEHLFITHCQYTDVYERILQDIYTPKLTFPCKDHGDKVLGELIEFYIVMRMRQYTLKLNNDQKKKNQHTKKSAKFCKT